MTTPWTERFLRHGGVYALAVLGLHGLAVVLLVGALPRHPVLLGMGVLAYTLGLRHAFDPDHIAAIDNSVRKMLREDGRPQGTGFFFAAGHSSVVIFLAVLVAVGGSWVASQLPQWKQWGAVVGPVVSGLFLIVIGLVNLSLWLEGGRTFLRLRRGEPVDDAELSSPRGWFVGLLEPLFRLVSRSWHLFPLGFLFGLGFDTASEIALLALSTQGASQALPVNGVLALPLLFASGMSLMDTADGLFMTHAYRWASVSPLKKVYYNLSVTGLSVIVALVIGSVELVQVAAPEWGWHGGVIDWITNLDFGNLGYGLVALLFVAWGLSVGVWKILRTERSY